MSVTDYAGGYQYLNGVLLFFPTAEGYVNSSLVNGANVFHYAYNYTDHLGNIRLTYGVDPVTGVLKIMEENHYYPYGMKHANYNSGGNAFQKVNLDIALKAAATPSDPGNGGDLSISPFKYKYNGKEYQDELGLNMYDYGARNYEPAIGRWMNMDALSEKYPNISTYAYVANMPTIAIDPDGNEIILITSGGAKLQYRNGNAYYYGTEKRYSASGNTTIDKVIRSYQKIEVSNSKLLKSILNHLVNSNKEHVVSEWTGGRNVVLVGKGSTYTKGSDERTGTQTLYDFSNDRKASFKESTGVEFSEFAITVHEMGHQYDYDIGNMGDSDGKTGSESPTEIRAVYLENIARAIENIPQRSVYGKASIDPKLLVDPPNFLPPFEWPKIEIPSFIDRKAPRGGDYIIKQ